MSVKALLKRSQVKLDGYYVVLVDQSAIVCFGTYLMLKMCLVLLFIACFGVCIHLRYSIFCIVFC